MAMNLGGGQIIDPSVQVGPSAAALNAQQVNKASQKQDALNTLNMLKQIADTNGWSMSHMAENFPEQMSYALDVVSGGNGGDFMKQILAMTPTQEQEVNYRQSLNAGKQRNLVDFVTRESQNKVADAVPGAAYSPEQVRANTPNNIMEQIRANSGMGMPSAQIPTGPIPGITNPDLNQAPNIPNQNSYLTPELIQQLISNAQIPTMAQGGQLADYEQKTGDYHEPALIGSQEMVMNKEAVKKYGNILEQMNVQNPNLDASGLPAAANGMPQYADGKGLDLSYAEQLLRQLGGTQGQPQTNLIDEMLQRGANGAQDARMREALIQQGKNRMSGVTAQDTAQANAMQAQAANMAREKDAQALRLAAQSNTQDDPGWQQVPYTEIMNNPDMYEINNVATGHLGIQPNAGGIVIARKKGPTAQPVDQAQVDQQTNEAIMTQPMGDKKDQGSNRLHPGAGTGSTNPVPPVTPKDETPVPEPIPEPTPDPSSPEGLALRQKVFTENKAATPAEYETVVTALGALPNMDKWNKDLATYAPSLAQYLPGPKYYADLMAQASDPMSVLDIQKTMAEIEKLQSQSYQALMAGDYSKAQSLGVEIDNLTKNDGNIADIESTRANRDYTLARTELTGYQSDQALANLQDLPMKRQQAMANLIKTVKETDAIMTPTLKYNLDGMSTWLDNYTKAGNKQKFLRENGAAGDDFVNALISENVIPSSTTENDRNLFGFGVGNEVKVPTGAVTTGTSVNYGDQSASDAAAQQAAAANRSGTIN